MVWLLGYLDTLGLDSGRIARQNGITPTDLESLEDTITGEQHTGVLRDALKESGDSGLGLKLGLQRSIATLDQFAYLVMSGSSLRESTKAGLRYQNYSGRFSGRLVITSFSQIEDEGCYQIHASSDLGDLRILAIEDVLANILKTCEWVLGRKLPVSRLVCDYPRPPHADRYETIFQCPIFFDKPAIQLYFDAEILDFPLPQSSPQSIALYEKLCEEKSISRNRGDVAWRVWQLLLRDPARPPALKKMAEELHCSSRTLSRKLWAQGWQYQQLVDQVREIHARRYLSDPTLSIAQAAQRTGYSDSSGFHRAFKKWTGKSPKAYREGLSLR
ncbi:MAG: AraC family transcriptional regulator [Halioglobus sp.]